MSDEDKLIEAGWQIERLRNALRFLYCNPTWAPRNEAITLDEWIDAIIKASRGKHFSRYGVAPPAARRA